MIANGREVPAGKREKGAAKHTPTQAPQMQREATNERSALRLASGGSRRWSAKRRGAAMATKIEATMSSWATTCKPGFTCASPTRSKVQSAVASMVTATFWPARRLSMEANAKAQTTIGTAITYMLSARFKAPPAKCAKVEADRWYRLRERHDGGRGQKPSTPPVFQQGAVGQESGGHPCGQNAVANHQRKRPPRVAAGQQVPKDHRGPIERCAHDERPVDGRGGASTVVWQLHGSSPPGCGTKNSQAGPLAKNGYQLHNLPAVLPSIRHMG